MNINIIELNLQYINNIVIVNMNIASCLFWQYLTVKDNQRILVQINIKWKDHPQNDFFCICHIPKTKKNGFSKFTPIDSDAGTLSESRVVNLS